MGALLTLYGDNDIINPLFIYFGGLYGKAFIFT